MNFPEITRFCRDDPESIQIKSWLCAHAKRQHNKILWLCHYRNKLFRCIPRKLAFSMKVAISMKIKHLIRSRISIPTYSENKPQDEKRTKIRNWKEISEERKEKFYLLCWVRKLDDFRKKLLWMNGNRSCGLSKLAIFEFSGLCGIDFLTSCQHRQKKNAINRNRAECVSLSLSNFDVLKNNIWTSIRYQLTRTGYDIQNAYPVISADVRKTMYAIDFKWFWARYWIFALLFYPDFEWRIPEM